MEISYSSWPWHRSDATALAGYANMMMMIWYRTGHYIFALWFLSSSMFLFLFLA